MKKHKVFDRKQLPAHLPLLSTMVAYLMLDKFNAVGWVWGCVGTVYAILWLGSIISLLTEEPIDLLNKNDVQK